MTLLSALSTLRGAGDLDAAMRKLADDVEWVVPGDSAISGVYRGRDEVARLLMALAEGLPDGATTLHRRMATMWSSCRG